MSKRAEQKALEAYPDTYTKYRKEGDPEGVKSGICTIPDTHDLERISFVNGYEQAEKDLVLTWEDIKCIDEIMSAIITSVDAIDLASWNDEKYYTEILNRFNKSKR